VAPAYQALIGGIAEFHRAQGWITAKQANAVKISAHKAGTAVPDTLITRETLQSPVAASNGPQNGDNTDDDGPFPEHNVTIARAEVKMQIEVGDRLKIINGICTGKY
jgi:hypothetical protein